MTAPATRPRRPVRRRRRKIDPVKAWTRRLGRTRPDLVRDTLDRLATIYGRPAWERRLDPTSELILTILTQNSADTNAEKAFVSALFWVRIVRISSLVGSSRRSQAGRP